MRRIMLRVEDDLYHALNNAAHDARQSMNTWITNTIQDKVEDDTREKAEQ